MTRCQIMPRTASRASAGVLHRRRTHGPWRVGQDMNTSRGPRYDISNGTAMIRIDPGMTWATSAYRQPCSQDPSHWSFWTPPIHAPRWPGSQSPGPCQVGHQPTKRVRVQTQRCADTLRWTLAHPRSQHEVAFVEGDGAVQEDGEIGAAAVNVSGDQGVATRKAIAQSPWPRSPKSLAPSSPPPLRYARRSRQSDQIALALTEICDRVAARGPPQGNPRPAQTETHPHRAPTSTSDPAPAVSNLPADVPISKSSVASPGKPV